mgnify:CR=1 FL=1
MKVFVIDNSQYALESFSVIDAEVTCYTDEVQAFYAVEQQQPEFIFLNYAVRGEQTPGYIEGLLSVAASASVVVIGNNTSEDAIFNCLLTGARGYQDWQQLPRYLSKLIRVLAEGEAWFSRKMVARVLANLSQSSPQAVWV